MDKSWSNGQTRAEMKQHSHSRNASRTLHFTAQVSTASRIQERLIVKPGQINRTRDVKLHKYLTSYNRFLRPLTPPEIIIFKVLFHLSWFLCVVLIGRGNKSVYFFTYKSSTFWNTYWGKLFAFSVKCLEANTYTMAVVANFCVLQHVCCM